MLPGITPLTPEPTKAEMLANVERKLALQKKADRDRLASKAAA
jgi:hypothetical protein